MGGETIAPVRGYNISQDESERLRIMKLWLCIMVVFIHSYTETVNFAQGQIVLDMPAWLDWTQYVLSQVIFQCTVPGFFFMSAILLYRKDFTWAGNLRKKARTLLVPYLLINTAWIAIFFIAQHIGALSPYFSQGEKIVSNWTVRDYLSAYGVGFSWEHDSPISGALWFMRDLMVLNVLAVAIKKVIDRFPRLVFLLMVAMLLFNIEPNALLRHKRAIVFFSLGYYFVKYDIHVTVVDKLDPVLLAGLYGISAILSCTLRDMPQQQMVMHFSIILGFMFFMRFATKVRSPNWKRKLLALSGYAMPIYLFHGEILLALKKLMIKFLPTNTFFQVVEYFGAPIVIIALCVAGSWVLKKWMPRLYAVLTGGRTM